MIVEELQPKRNARRPRSPAGTEARRSSHVAFSEELQLHLRMSTLVPILSFDNQRIGEEEKEGYQCVSIFR